MTSTPAPQDLFDSFTDAYEQGQFLSALQKLIPSPQVSYDSLTSRESQVFPFLINYADACIFKSALEYRHTAQILINLLRNDPRLNNLLALFIEQLEEEYSLFYWFTIADEQELHEASTLPDQLKELIMSFKKGEINALESLYSVLPPIFEPLFRQKSRIQKGWQQFQKIRPLLAQKIAGEDWFLHQPWHPFVFPQKLSPIDINPNGQIPLIIVESLEGIDYRAFLAPYVQQECFLVFETKAHFFHFLQFSEWHEIWDIPHVGLYILECYPQDQFSAQNIRWEASKTFRPVLMTPRNDLEKVIPLIEQALKQCLLQPSSEWGHDTACADWLYAIGKQHLFKHDTEKYGKSRTIALNIDKGLQQWYDPHKGLPPAGADLGPPPPDYLNDLLLEASKQRKPRILSTKKRLRLAHVVPQIVDGGHAPTRLLKVLCEFSDHEKFELDVLSTERLAEHDLEYPIVTYSSLSSLERGKHSIQILEELGVRVSVDSQSPTYLSAAQLMMRQLHDKEIDIAVFHGPDPINEWCASASNVPVRVFFEHGTVPLHSCFDLLILSTQEAYDQNHERFRQLGMETHVLPFCVDIRKGWKERPYTNEELGLPPGAFVMTTISNHLDSRLSTGMCQAIGEILERCPKAVYAPIGEVRQQQRFREIFASYGVNDRVIFLGYRENPGQIARSMQLFLNEFPFGSCVGMLDAMAAGCPVVSMYDENGPQQARYGATNFGLEYVVKTGLKKDYVGLACRLIDDPIFYKKWSEHAVEEYEKRVNVRQYVKDFEKLLL